MSDRKAPTPIIVFGGAVATVVVFVPAWFVIQWAWWILGAVMDWWARGWPIYRYYDPDSVGFIQQLVRDLIPLAAGMFAASWAAQRFLGGSRMGFRIGVGVILLVFAYGFVLVARTALDGHPTLGLGAAVGQLAALLTAGIIARWIDQDWRSGESEK